MNVSGFPVADFSFQPVVLTVSVDEQEQQDAIVNAYADMDRLYARLHEVLGEEEADILANLIENMAVTLLQLDGSISDDDESSDEIETDSQDAPVADPDTVLGKTVEAVMGSDNETICVNGIWYGMI